MAFDRVKSISVLSAPTAVKGFVGTLVLDAVNDAVLMLLDN